MVSENNIEPEFDIQPGDLGGLMARYAHIRVWVEAFEKKHGTRPIYYGWLDSGARKIEPCNLIYATRPPCFAHVYKPLVGEDEAGATLWFGLEPTLENDEEEEIKFCGHFEEG